MTQKERDAYDTCPPAARGRFGAGAHWLAVTPPGSAAANLTRALQFRTAAPLQAFFFGATAGSSSSVGGPSSAAETGEASAAAEAQPRQARLQQLLKRSASSPPLGPRGSTTTAAAASPRGVSGRPTAPPLSPPPFSALAQQLPQSLHLLTYMPADPWHVTLAQRAAAATSASAAGGEGEAQQQQHWRPPSPAGSSSTRSSSNASLAYLFIRLEHIFEVDGGFAFDPQLSASAEADLRSLVPDGTRLATPAAEVNIVGTRRLKQRQGQEEEGSSGGSGGGAEGSTSVVKLAPMEIRAFVVTVEAAQAAAQQGV